MPTSLCECSVNICKSLQVARAAKTRQLQRALPYVLNGAKTITTMTVTGQQLRVEFLGSLLGDAVNKVSALHVNLMDWI